MEVMRKLGLGVLYPLLTLSLLAFGVLISLKMTAGRPQPLKQALEKSDVYQLVIEHVVSQEQANSRLGNFQLTPAEIRTAAQKALPAPFVQQSVHQIVDSTYAWMQGKTASPEFKIDLAPVKARLGDQAGQYIQSRLNSLPPCGYADLARLPGDIATVNPYTLTCVPPGFDTAEAIPHAKQLVIDSTDFLQQDALTASTLKNDDGQTLTEQLHDVPDMYRALITGLYVAGSVAVVSLGLIVLLHRGRRAGLQKLGISIASIGVVSAVTGWLVSTILDRGAQSLGRSAEASNLLQSTFASVVHILTNDLRTWWVGFGLLAAAAGIILWLLATYIRRPKTPQDTPERPAHMPASGEQPLHPVDR